MQITSNLHSNVSRSTRINSSSVHTYIFVCFTLRVFLQGFVTQNATTCSFQQEMDNMATNQVFLPSQFIPNLWGSRRGLLEGLSLLGPPSCLASLIGGAGHSRTCSPKCAGFIQDPDKIQPSPFRSGESNSGLWEEVTPICQTSCRVVLGGPGERKRGCGGV